MYQIGKSSKQGFIFCASVLVTLLAACGGSEDGGSATLGATATNTPVPTATATIATTPAQLNPNLLGSYNKAFYQGGGAGCGTVCSYTEGQTVSVALLAGNILSLNGRQLSNPYFRILGGSPHTPEIILA